MDLFPGPVLFFFFMFYVVSANNKLSTPHKHTHTRTCSVVVLRLQACLFFASKFWRSIVVELEQECIVAL